MATIGGSDVVKDGLVLALDAANARSYVSGSTTWRDVSGNARSGSLTNGPTFNSENGGSIVFDGADDYADYGNIINFERTDSFSINSWINITSLSVFRAVVTKMNSSFVGYAFIVEPFGELTFILRNTLSTNSLFVRTSANLVLDRWFNITVTYSGNSLPSGVNFYINSVIHPVNTIVNNTLTQTIITTQPLNIGARTSNLDGYFLGRISQVQIYNRALPQSEILQNYNAQKSRFNL